MNALSMIVSNSKAKEEIFRSNFPLSDVSDFLAGYQNTMNKDDYLKNYATEEKKKPYIIYQIEAAIVSVLNKYGLGYHVGAGGEKEMAQSALRESIKTFIFLLENWGMLSRDIVRNVGTQILKVIKRSTRTINRN